MINKKISLLLIKIFSGKVSINFGRQYIIKSSDPSLPTCLVFQSKIKNPYGTTPSNLSGLLNSGPARYAGEIVIVGWHQCVTSDPCFLIKGAYDDSGTKKDFSDKQVPVRF